MMNIGGYLSEGEYSTAGSVETLERMQIYVIVRSECLARMESNNGESRIMKC